MNNPKQEKGGNIKSEPQPKQEVLDPLTVEIQRQVGDLLPQGSRQEIIRRITSVVYSENFSGPIAHPKHLREYDQILPGAADRIIGMAEKQQNHHIDMDNKVVDYEFNDRKRGMDLGAATFLFLIVCALAASVLSGPVAGGLFLIPATIGGVGLFVNGRKNGNGDSE